MQRQRLQRALQVDAADRFDEHCVRSRPLRQLEHFHATVNRAIGVHMTNLRKKIELVPKEPKHIKTVWGVGYKFMP